MAREKPSNRVPIDVIEVVDPDGGRLTLYSTEEDVRSGKWMSVTPDANLTISRAAERKPAAERE